MGLLHLLVFLVMVATCRGVTTEKIPTTFCETQQPCRSGGTCRNSEFYPYYYCICPRYYTGQKCEYYYRPVNIGRTTGYPNYQTTGSPLCSKPNPDTTNVPVRLVAGPHPLEGRLEVFYCGQWGTVCDDSFDFRSARVVCKMLGHDTNNATAYHGARYGPGYGPIWLDDVSCRGDEKNLAMCKHLGWGVNNCGHGEDVSVSCNGTSGPLEATTMGYYNGCWSSPCRNGGTCYDTGFGRYRCSCPAYVSGYNCQYTNGGYYYTTAGYGPHGNVSSWDNDTCTFEQGLCGFTQDSSDSFDWRRYSGRTSSYNTGPSYDHTTGSGGYYMYIEASNTYSGARARLISPTYQPSSGVVCLNFWYHMYGQTIGALAVKVKRSGSSSEETIWMLRGNQYNGWNEASVRLKSQGPFNVIFEATRGSSYTGDIAIDDVTISRCEETKEPWIRLVEGRHPAEGRVEVYYQGQWGTVCDDNFGYSDARAICGMMGYRESEVQAYQNARFGPGSGPIWLDDLNCTGHENSLVHCPGAEWGRHNCAHHEDASVSCDVNASANATSSGRWNTTDSPYWHRTSQRWPYWGMTTQRPSYYCPNDPCSSSPCYNGGTCWSTRNTYYNRYRFYCQCPTGTSGKYCESYIGWPQYATTQSWHQGIRLVGGKTPYEGRVEVYHNGEWGTICDDNFDVNDARVICRMLGYGTSSVAAYQGGRFGQGYGRIWLDDLRCRGYEHDVTSCSHAGWGRHNCGHQEDASVSCSAGGTLTTRKPWGYEMTTQQASCRYSPCRNGGTCVDYGNGFYHCYCPPKTSGRNCEYIGECTVNPCMNGGTCRNVNYPPYYYCMCPRYYSGQKCESYSDPCRYLTCYNGGSCVRRWDSFATCQCYGPYTGRQCEYRMEGGFTAERGKGVTYSWE